MTDQARGLVTWILGGVGALFLYCGIKGVTPASVVGTFVNKSNPVKPLGGATSATTAAGAVNITASPTVDANGTYHGTTPIGSMNA